MPSWRDNLRPGSFRGVAFYCRDTSNDAGQRLAIFEFPDSDSIYVQDLGRGVKQYQLEIYVAGDDYMAQRAALEAALDADGPGTLVHPYKGRLQVYAKHPCRLRELSTQGRAAFFDVTFVEAGGPEPPLPATNTAATTQNACAALQPLLAAAYQPAYDGQSTTVQSAFAEALANVQTAISSALTAVSGVLQLGQDLEALAVLAPDAVLSYATQLAALLGDYVANIVATFTPETDESLAPGYQDWSRLPALPGDPSFGLAALAALDAATLSPGTSGTAAANAVILASLVSGSATAALVSLYAQTSFDSAADADAARAQVYGLIVAQIEASAGTAGGAGAGQSNQNDALVQAWRGVMTAAVADLTTRASLVPDVATVDTISPMPALVLAQMLYQDGTEAPVLVQRNAAPHPLFMPLAVEYLQS